MREADNARDLASTPDETEEGLGGPRTRAAYELTAVVAHIVGDAEEQERLKKKRERAEPGKAEGHIVAHIKAGHPRCLPRTSLLHLHKPKVTSYCRTRQKEPTWVQVHCKHVSETHVI